MSRLLSILILISFSLTEEYLAVMSLDPMGLNDVEANILSERLTSKLISLKKYTVIERSNVEKILKEQKFQYSGCTDTKCAVEIGKMLNSNYIVIGNVSKLGSTYSIDCRIIDVETVEAISSASFTTKGNVDDLLKGIDNIALQLYGLEDYGNDESTSLIKNKKEAPSQVLKTTSNSSSYEPKKTKLYISYSRLGYESTAFLDGDEIGSVDGDYDSGALSIGFDYNIRKRIAIGSSWDIICAKNKNMDEGEGFVNIYGKFFLPPLINNVTNSKILLWGLAGYNIPLQGIEDYDGGLSYGFGVTMSNGVEFSYVVNTISFDDYLEGIPFSIVGNSSRFSCTYNFNF